ncbi:MULTISPECIES: FecR family protein [Flavobacteriaceae]|uniref:FecR family protein n=1 Tax=Flavobacteriaceae TaxID=49546 RepID=UPI00234A94B8|nr:FecR family protein [Muricauda sp. SP22]MDC6361286.1 FecR domain-containing protein [Muricauda sp. SP22]
MKRYQDGNTTPEEEQMLLNYLESFQAAQEDSWPLELGNSEELKNSILTGILQNIKKDKSSTYINRRFSYIPLFRYAASIVLITGAFYFFNEMYGTPNNGLHNQKGDDSIVLKLENGNTSVITENDNKDIMDSHGNVVGVQSGNTITYGKAKKEPKELVYNELTVPLGKKFDLVLSDGTSIKLNAGSTIKYPVQFVETTKRVVQIWGEAFFDVTKDEARPFQVIANNVQVEVLGTKFNVSSYPEDDDISTVLVEGSVKLSSNSAKTEENSFMIVPNQKASWNKENATMTIEEVETDIYTSWINGRIIFKNIPFKNIRKKLERRYNVTIINNNKALDEKFYNASFDIETIEQVMKAFKENYSIDYEIADNQIIIN